MKIYTKTGDEGTTSLIGGGRVPKDDTRVEAYGNVDELMAFVASLRDGISESDDEMREYRYDLKQILDCLMAISCLLALDCNCSTRSAKMVSLSMEDIDYLEKRIDEINSRLRPVKGFTVPGGHPLTSMTHVCRTVCRRAERRCVTAGRDYYFAPEVLVYLNRLSDYFYLLGRRFVEYFHVEESYWQASKS